MTTIAERIKENRKRSRPIESQPEDIIYQNQDQDSNLTPQQKGRIFEEQCQELIRSQGITCTLSQASRWNKGSSHQRKYTKKIKYDGYESIIYETHIPTNLKEILTRSEPIKTQLRQTIVNEGGIYIRRTDGEEIYFNNVQINEAITY